MNIAQKASVCKKSFTNLLFLFVKTIARRGSARHNFKQKVNYLPIKGYRLSATALENITPRPSISASKN